ncbi:ABHD3 [Symbiodinium necroappetens]|uniref:ABHD3 protein n=1 Tax=Symbiodinium necroappetens TaxID=1628268 RepID=A0A812KSG9_9DINO|nr:ABHD3 [Symbiodinium necroappetens]
MAGRDVAKGAVLGATSATALAVMLMRRYLREELRPAVLFHSPVDEKHPEDQRLLQQVKLVLSDYWPHPILEFSGYFSTMYSCLWAVMPSMHMRGRMEVLELSDGGTMSLHWYEPPLTDSGRVVVLLPGLNNDSRTSFVQSSMRHFRHEGFQAVALNYRGLAGQELKTSKVGCADCWRDMPEVEEHLGKVCAGAEFSAVAFSMGGVILLRHLGEMGAKTLFSSAVTVASPVDVPAVISSFNSSIRKRLTNYIMTTGVKRSKFRHLVDMNKLLSARGIADIDQAAICPLHGYATASEYHEAISPRPHLNKISIPTLLVHAEDDPVISYSTMPFQDLRRNPKLYVAVTKRGGHIGWGSGGLGAGAWTDTMAAHFMQATSRTQSRDIEGTGIAGTETRPFPAPFSRL